MAPISKASLEGEPGRLGGARFAGGQIVVFSEKAAWHHGRHGVTVDSSAVASAPEHSRQLAPTSGDITPGDIN
jgi:hypothetical protein